MIEKYCKELTTLLQVGYECIVELHKQNQQKPVEYAEWRNLLERKCQQQQNKLTNDESRWLYETLVFSPIKSLPKLELQALVDNLSYSKPIPVLMAGTRLVFVLKSRALVAELLTPLCMKRFKPPHLQCCSAGVKYFCPNQLTKKKSRRLKHLSQKLEIG